VVTVQLGAIDFEHEDEDEDCMGDELMADYAELEYFCTSAQSISAQEIQANATKTHKNVEPKLASSDIDVVKRVRQTESGLGSQAERLREEN